MFQNFRNIDSAFKHVKWFTIVLIAACVVICCYTVATTVGMLDRGQQRIYVLANEKAIEAFASDRKDNVPVEARDHIRTFHQLFFSLSPDDKAIEATIRRALYLADASAKEQYDDLKENGYYSGIISANISQEMLTDSVSVNLASYPYFFRYYGRQRIIRTTAIVTRSLVTEGYLRNVSRSDNNPHGFLIERWRTVENNDLQTEKR